MKSELCRKKGEEVSSKTRATELTKKNSVNPTTETGNNTVCSHPLKSNKLKDTNKNYLKNAIDILEKAQENDTIMGKTIEKPEEKKGFWSFLNNFRCGKTDQNQN